MNMNNVQGKQLAV